MNYKTRKKHLRLEGYDYAQAGCYFVTICTYRKQELFGFIKNEKMVLNVAGQMIDDSIIALSHHFRFITIDEYVVMPDHIHIIIIINYVGADLCVGPLTNNGPAQKIITLSKHNNGQAQRPVPTHVSISNIIRRFKTATMKKYIDGIRNDGWHPFKNHVWQRSFNDRIIRNENELNKIREYIINNPSDCAIGKPDDAIDPPRLLITARYKK
jgi:putative transposase